MKKLLSLIFNPWLIAIVGLIALALLIWFVGPAITIFGRTPLASETARLITIGALVLLYLARKAWSALGERKRNGEVVSQLVAQAPAGAAGAPESADLKVARERFEAALKRLRDTRIAAKRGVWSSLHWTLGKQYVYQLPWYVILGNPGAGKTTALQNSALQFPLSDEFGRKPIKGVGGTRNCDWFFTDRAVLIDTAGRYTTHDSDERADRESWHGFLALLKRFRPRRPINGVLVAISVEDLLLFSGERRAEHGAQLRSRLRELQAELGVRPPVYVMLTKCDLLAGFVDYFADIDKAERGQAWGMTFPYEASLAGNAVDGFGAEFDRLTARLLGGVIGRVQGERDLQRRARIYGFPQQFGGLRDALDEILHAVFQTSTYDAAALLRGVYFISGTQEGTPIDRMLGAISRELKLERLVLPPNQNSGRSYFVSRVLEEVVFPESELAGANLKWERRRQLLAFGVYAALAVVGVSLLGLWSTSYLTNRRHLAHALESAIAVKADVDHLPSQSSPDLMPILPALSEAQDLKSLVDPADVPWTMRFGLYQGNRLGAAADQTYDKLLSDAMLPRLAARVEQQLRTRGDNLDALYESLKVYIMLTSPEHFDSQALAQVTANDWDQGGLPADITPDQRARLKGHLDRLLAASATGEAATPLSEDPQLVQAVREQLRSVPLAQRVYTRLKLQGVGGSAPEFTIAKAAAPTALSVFSRASGKELTTGVPGLYTRDGYYGGFQKAVGDVTAQLAREEPWVLGVPQPSAAVALDPRTERRLADDVRKLYFADYIKVWEGFIQDIRLVRTGDLPQVLQAARILSQPENPLSALMQGIVRETTLVPPDSQSGVAKIATNAIENLKQGAANVVGAPAMAAVGAGPADHPEAVVDERFADLRRYVNGVNGQPPPINASIALIADIYTLLIAADAAIKAGNVPPASDVPTKVSADGPRNPEPVRTLLATLSARAVAATTGGGGANLGAKIKAEIGDFCQQATSGRYPFVRNSARDVTQDDFGRLFAPGGLFDAFFDKNLNDLVDRSTTHWTFRQFGDVRMGDPAGALLQFQHADAIRKTFFQAGARQASLRLEFKPIEMDAEITQFILDVDGQLVKYSHGPQIPMTVAWPGPRGSNQVRIELSPARSNAAGAVAEGPWALFRLLDRAQIERADVPERSRVTFNVDGRRATFEVTASSVQNPFRMPDLDTFRCPQGL